MCGLEPDNPVGDARKLLRKLINYRQHRGTAPIAAIHATKPHIRVIYYDMTDPFWGQKLIDKVAENILSAIKNPEEAIFFATKE